MVKRKSKIKKSKKLVVTGWILEACLSDGRTVTLDVDDQAAGEVDSFLAEVEEKEGLEEWIVHNRTNIEKYILRHQLKPQLKEKEV